jgi:GNAT superfamily N-acetyltransferase
MDKSERYRQVARLHVANIGKGFLATLGQSFLALMYRAIDEGAGSVLLVDECDGQVTGFVSGGTGMGPIYRQMFRYPLRLVQSLLPTVFRPRRVLRIVEILRYGRRSATQGELPEAELLSIVVDPAHRGQGVAEKLYRRLVEHFGATGVSAFRITVGDALMPAHRFYMRMGAAPIGKVQVHAGEPSTVYVHHVRTPATHVDDP